MLSHLLGFWKSLFYHNCLFIYLFIYLLIYLFIYLSLPLAIAHARQLASLSTLAWLRCTTCVGHLGWLFKLNPHPRHQHCTDEAQKAETVLSAVIYLFIYLSIYLVFNHKKSKLNLPFFFRTSIFLTVTNIKSPKIHYRMTSYSTFQNEYRRSSFVSNKCKSLFFFPTWFLVVLELLIQPPISRHPTAHLGDQQDAVALANKSFSQKCHGKYHLVHQVRGGSLNVSINFSLIHFLFLSFVFSPCVL